MNAIVTKKYNLSNIKTAFKDFLDKPCWVASDKNKKPINPHTGHYAECNDPTTWVTFSEVESYILEHDNSLPAIVLSEELGITAIDLDKVLIESTGEFLPDLTELQGIVNQTSSYTEISQSGRGVHIFLKGSKPVTRSKKKLSNVSEIEIYGHGKFITLTGSVLENRGYLTEDQSFIDTICEKYIPKEIESSRVTLTPSPQLSDDEVITMCQKAKNADKFRLLFDKGDIASYGDDHSSADLALCSLFAFYTQNLEQIDRLFRQSKLYRPKWDRKDYRDRTTKIALSSIKETWRPKNQVESNSYESVTTIFTGLCEEQLFPLDDLPIVLRDIVRKISTQADSDPAISGTAAQALAATALRRTVRVIEKIDPYLQHYTTFFHTVVGESAQSRKSANTKPLLRVFERYHKDAKQEYEKQNRIYSNAKDLVKTKKDEIKKDTGKTIEDRAKQLAEIDTKIEELKPKYYRLFTTDTTGPAFVMRLSDTNGYYGVFTTDGGDLLDYIIGSPQAGTNDMIFVKLVTNDDIQADRVGPDRKGVCIDIPEPCGNVFIITQEERWVRFNTHPRLKGSGLLGRNNPAIIAPRQKGYIEDKAESKKYPVTNLELQAWEELITTFLNFKNEIELTLSNETTEARRLLNNYYQSTVGIEQSNYDVSDIIHRFVSECVKRSALFHVCDHYRNLEKIPKEIPLDTFKRAVKVQTYYVQQAINARRGDFSKAESMEIISFLKKWIKRAEKEKSFSDYISPRDLNRNFHPPRGKLDGFLQKLEESNVVKILPQEGKKASRYILNISKAKKFIGVTNEKD